jgi:pimeloyl-ACP methyl ester carboxylesterase
VLLALAGATVVCVGKAAVAAPRLTGEHACPGLSGFTCSTLRVPLGPGRALGLQVAAADNAAAPRGVLLFLTGGPGEPGVPFVPRIAKALGPVLADYRLVVLDQRGTGATALRCPALQEAMGSSDLTPPPASAVRSCGRALGARRALYGTDDVVADLELLRRALGVSRWTLDGVSYGTFVAERYALAHPERVDRLVLDSVVPHNAGFGLVPVELRAVGRVLRAVCGNATCGEDLAVVVRRDHDGPQLLDALTAISIVDPTFRGAFDVPALLRQAARGDDGALDAALRTVRGWQSAPAQALSQGLHASALCADWRFPWGDSSAPLAAREEKLAEAVAGADLWPFDRSTARRLGLAAQCLPWPPAAATPAAPRLLPGVPTLLLAGGHDLSTPLEWTRREAALTPAGRLVVVPGAGHDVQIRAVSDRGRHAIQAFLQ